MNAAERRRVDGILVDGVQLGKDKPQHRRENVSWQPRDPVDGQQPLSQRRLADPQRASDKIDNAATRGGIVSARTGQLLTLA